MQTYLVMIWLSATPAIWSGGYMEVSSMSACHTVARHMAEDPLNDIIPTTYFCSQDIIDPRMLHPKQEGEK